MAFIETISSSRRRFLGNGLKLAVLSGLLIPFQKTLASGTAAIRVIKKRVNNFLSIDKIVLNTKTGVVHLPSGKIFSKYPTIKRQAIFANNNWEIQVKPPYHFNKEKSGIILEMLALTRLSTGINDRTLTDAFRILSIAFSNTYKSKKGVLINKYKFRLHYLLLQVIALNNTFTTTQKWEKFQSATGRINYNLQEKKPLPKHMNWVKNKTEFDKRVKYILQNNKLISVVLPNELTEVNYSVGFCLGLFILCRVRFSGQPKVAEKQPFLYGRC